MCAAQISFSCFFFMYSTPIFLTKRQQTVVTCLDREERCVCVWSLSIEFRANDYYMFWCSDVLGLLAFYFYTSKRGGGGDGKATMMMEISSVALAARITAHRHTLFSSPFNHVSIIRLADGGYGLQTTNENKYKKKRQPKMYTRKKTTANRCMQGAHQTHFSLLLLFGWRKRNKVHRNAAVIKYRRGDDKMCSGDVEKRGRRRKKHKSVALTIEMRNGRMCTQHSITSTFHRMPRITGKCNYRRYILRTVKSKSKKIIRCIHTRGLLYRNE